MAASLIHLPYFPNISHLTAVLRDEYFLLEHWDHYTKQTYRNRTKILGPNGILNLTIPVIHSQKNRSYYRDVKIKNSENWQVNHWRSIETCYNSSPFFEFYKDDLIELYELKFDLLYEFNLKCLEKLNTLLNLNLIWKETVEFLDQYTEAKDFRYLIKAKKEPIFNFDPYTQVFSEKHGFATNLSILDLLFNEGPNTQNYLKQQNL